MKHAIACLFLLLLSFQSLNISARTIFVGKQEEYKTLQQAIDRAGAGDKISINSGTYISNNPISIVEKQDLTIIGQGQVNLYTDNRYEKVLYITDSTNIHLKNLHMKHTNPPNNTVCIGEVVLLTHCSNIKLESCEIDGCGLFGIRAFTCSQITIEQCFIHNNSNSAFDMDTVDNLVLLNNRIVDNGDLFFSKHNLTNLIMEGNTMQIDLDYRTLEEVEDAYFSATEPEEKIFGTKLKLELVLLEKTYEEVMFRSTYSSHHLYLVYPAVLQEKIDNLDINQTYMITFAVKNVEMTMMGLIFYGELLEIH